MPNVHEIESFLTSIYRYEDEDGSPVSHVHRLRDTLAHPLTALAALRYVMSFPILRVSIPNTEMSLKQSLFGPRRPWRHHGFISSYVELPSPLHGYWQGTSKQNLRTRTRQGRVAGFEVRVVDDSEIIDLISQVFADKGWELRGIESELRARGMRRGESLIGVGVFDPSGHVVGFSVGTQTGDVVRTLWSCASQKGPVRWLCFSGYVEEVSARGGRIIVESAPWGFTGGNKIFAGHLGFVPARIRSS